MWRPLLALSFVPLLVSALPGAAHGQWAATGPVTTFHSETGSPEVGLQTVRVAPDGARWLTAWTQVTGDSATGSAWTRSLDLSGDPESPSPRALQAAADVASGAPLDLRSPANGLPRLLWISAGDPCPPATPECGGGNVLTRAIDTERGSQSEAIQINDPDTGPSFEPGGSAVFAARSNGEFLVVWPDGTAGQLRARSFNADGRLQDDSGIVVNAAAGHRVEFPTLVVRPGGSYLLAWLERSDEPTDPVLLRSRFLDVRGSGDDLPVTLAEIKPGAAQAPAMAFAADGRGLVAWLDAGPTAEPDAKADRVLSLAISSAGTFAPLARTVTLDEDGLRGLDLTPLATGFAAAWLSLDTLTVETRTVSLTGEPEGPLSTLASLADADAPWDLTSDGHQELVLSWADASGSAVARRFGADCGPQVLCLGDDRRFHVAVTWRVGDRAGKGTTRPAQTLDTGSFWFFNDSNVELVVKVLDGRAINGSFWVFYGSLTDVAFELRITDTLTGRRVLYLNEQGSQASNGDTRAFPGA